MTIERFQILNMVEIFRDEADEVQNYHCSIRVLDENGKGTHQVANDLILTGLVDGIASVYLQVENPPMDKEGFIEDISNDLRNALEETEVTKLH